MTMCGRISSDSDMADLFCNMVHAYTNAYINMDMITLMSTPLTYYDIHTYIHIYIYIYIHTHIHVHT